MMPEGKVFEWTEEEERMEDIMYGWHCDISSEPRPTLEARPSLEARIREELVVYSLFDSETSFQREELSEDEGNSECILSVSSGEQREGTAKFPEEADMCEFADSETPFNPEEFSEHEGNNEHAMAFFLKEDAQEGDIRKLTALLKSHGIDERKAREEEAVSFEAPDFPFLQEEK
ncbi:MAG: uncharacterized protein A8A55_1123 [Amphiamblys sp. WSBS2006]|nr:MAG: uncharacterized protein A8A55_1123 [Amphiamblys sp. WSBS2006]